MLAAAAVFVVAGCWQGVGSSSPAAELGERVEDYYRLLMWKYYDRCSAYVSPRDRASFEAFVLASGNDLNITSYEIRSVTMSPGGGEAVVSLKVTYYMYPSVTEKTVLLRERWVRQEGGWFLRDPRYGVVFSAPAGGGRRP